MARLRILYDHSIFAAQAYGGVSRMFFELTRRLAGRDDTDLLLFAGFHVNRYPLSSLRGPAARFFGLRLPAFRGSGAVLEPLNRLGLRLFLGNRPVDRYHPSHYSEAAARWQASPLVVTVNDLIPESFPDDFPDLRRRLACKRACIERADLIITISRATRCELLSRYPMDEGRVRVVYPGAPDPPPPVEPLRFSRPYWLYVGTRRQGYKNFGGLLSAYAAAGCRRDVDLCCFGGPNWSPGERRHLARLGLTGRVHHLVGDDRLLARLYAGALAFVYPSLCEGFGLPPLEAMASGCPVLAGRDAGAVPEVLGDAAAYFDARDPGSIQACLDHLAADEHRRRGLSERGRAQAARYSWDQMAAETRQAYETLGG